MNLDRWILNTFAICLMFTNASAALGANCDLGAHARCLDCNDTELLCDNGLQGWTKGSAKADEIEITVHTANGSDLTYQFDNPSKGVSSYFGDLSQNSEILSFLQTQAGIQVKPGMQVHVGSAFFRSLPPLANDPVPKPGAVSPAPVASQTNSGDKGQLRCLYDSGTPDVAKGASCGGAQLCVGPVTCMQNGKIVAKNIMAGCRSKNGVCPSATDCANDPNITMDSASASSSGDLQRDELPKSTTKGVVQ